MPSSCSKALITYNLGEWVGLISIVGVVLVSAHYCSILGCLEYLINLWFTDYRIVYMWNLKVLYGLKRMFGMIQLWLWNSLDPLYKLFLIFSESNSSLPSPSYKPQDRRASRHRINIWWQNVSFYTLMLNIFSVTVTGCNITGHEANIW